MRTIHGFSTRKNTHKLYKVLSSMKDRCNNPKSKAYPTDGGRGIKVCKEWEDSYESFILWSFKNGYKDGLTIERKNNDLGYSPENCRFATKAEQQLNTNGKNSRNTTGLIGVQKNKENWWIYCCFSVQEKTNICRKLYE